MQILAETLEELSQVRYGPILDESDDDVKLWIRDGAGSLKGVGHLAGTPPLPPLPSRSLSRPPILCRLRSRHSKDNHHTGTVMSHGAGRVALPMERAARELTANQPPPPRRRGFSGIGPYKVCVRTVPLPLPAGWSIRTTEWKGVERALKTDVCQGKTLKKLGATATPVAGSPKAKPRQPDIRQFFSKTG